jgi:hypothetical protein
VLEGGGRRGGRGGSLPGNLPNEAKGSEPEVWSLDPTENSYRASASRPATSSD